MSVSGCSAQIRTGGNRRQATDDEHTDGIREAAPQKGEEQQSGDDVADEGHIEQAAITGSRIDRSSEQGDEPAPEAVG